MAHALVEEVCSQNNLRAFAVKGLVNLHYRLRERQGSSDADVWVAPEDFSTLLERLGELGWLPRPDEAGPRVLELHSVSLVHQQWPCDVDVHRYYPGFLADPAVVFEVMWERRAQIPIAGVTVTAADRPSAVAVMALHALRDMQQSRNTTEFASLRSMLVHEADPAFVADLSELARRTWCMDTLAPLLGPLGIRLPRPSTSEYRRDLAKWEVRRRDNSPTSAWLAEMRSEPVATWPRQLWRAAFLPGPMFREYHPETPQGSAALVQARVRRLGRGVKALPHALVAMVRSARGGSA
ncbi:nucleotidyltransferase family protein [Dermacoccaceae bacterium W4C1]